MNQLKNVIVLFLVMAVPFCGVSQDAKIKTSEKGSVLLNPNLTLGSYKYGIALDPVNILPPVGFNFEYATSNYFSFGLEGEYAVRRYRDFVFGLTGNSYNYQYKALSLRGSFHYLDLLKDLVSDDLFGFYQLDLDMYLGVSSGLTIINTTQKWKDGSTMGEHEKKTFDTNLRFGYFAGFRYYFSNNFGAFLETGRNTFGWAKIGLTLKF